ncbi:Transcriptional regulator [Bifidobacterium longum DJO10A]|uniref:Transcriptional regulator n=5 Tax=Bifidobacterium longum TaxID=216816 RepID=B3DST9_BIFLD|nr:Transcriptional regulator [Bifidobacterium longum DJO10A]
MSFRQSTVSGGVMTQESGGADPHINPPSFIPAGNRRTRPSGQVPRSFAPARTSRQSGQAPSARPSVTGNDIEEPQLNANATASANVADNGRRTPPSFSPKTGRATRSTAPDAAAPRSIPPSRARMSSGSSRNAVRNPSDMPVSRPSSPAANVSTKFSHLGRPAAATAKTVTARRPRALRITLCAIAVLVAALILSVFGAWQWVDSKLNRSDWLTDTPNTPASTWLILGSDERDGSTDYGGVDNISGFRTDTILVLIKPKSGPSSLVSIPRDSLMNVDNQYMKINAVALIAGKKALVSNVEQITGQKIDHVAQIKFGGLQNVVNALGGIELCYDEDVQDSYSGLNWKAGCHTADGSTALSFSRMRYADARGDFGRNERQRQVISAIVKKASSSETLTNPSKIVAVSNAAMSALTVDEKTNPYTLLTMALAFKSATGSNGISGSVYWSDPDYYVDGVGSSVLLDDAKNTELFNQLADGTYKAGTVGNLAEG